MHVFGTAGYNCNMAMDQAHAAKLLDEGTQTLSAGLCLCLCVRACTVYMF